MDALATLIETHPLELTLENIEEWKRVLNENRAIHYNDAFHAIDQVIQSLTASESELPPDPYEDTDR